MITELEYLKLKARHDEMQANYQANFLTASEYDELEDIIFKMRHYEQQNAVGVE